MTLTKIIHKMRLTKVINKLVHKMGLTKMITKYDSQKCFSRITKMVHKMRLLKMVHKICTQNENHTNDSQK